MCARLTIRSMSFGLTASYPWKMGICLTDLPALDLRRRRRTPTGPIPFLEFRWFALVEAANAGHTLRNLFLGQCLPDKLFRASATLPQHGACYDPHYFIG